VLDLNSRLQDLIPPLQVPDLVDGQSISFTPLKYEFGEAIITPVHAPQGKRVAVVRLHVLPGDVPHEPSWWDFTSSRLTTQIRGLLPRADLGRARWTITARGIPPKRYFSVEISPA
jgi:hypothetical protein